MRRGLWLVCGLLVACEGIDQPPAPYRDPVGGNGGGFIEVRLLDPLPWSTVTEPVVRVTVGVDSHLTVETVTVKNGEGDWQPLRESGDNYWLRLALRRGGNEITFRATDQQGNVEHFATRLYYAGEAPTVRLVRPVENGYAGANIPVAGEVETAPGSEVSLLEAWIDGDVPVVLPPAIDGGFEGVVPNGDSEIPELCVRVTDSEARFTQTCKLLRRDDDPPVLVIHQPQDGLVTQPGVLEVTGVAGDEIALDRVEVQVNDAGWITVGEPADFRANVILIRGANLLQVRAFDVAGNETLATLGVYAARTVTLRTYSADEGSLLTLTMDKAGLAALVPPADAESIDMLYLDVRGLLLESLRAMRDYDLYGMDTSTWGPAEWSMQRILSMTPDTADLSGTSLANILELSQGLGLPPAVVLADLADINATDPFLTLQETADGIFENIIEPHPGMVVDPEDGVKKIPVSLADALNDLVGLADTLGPAPPHPGILFEPSVSPVLLPNFQMTVTARSSLRQHDGVDLGQGKAYLFVAEPGAELLEFDFLNPEWFTVEGVADEPEVDLNFLIVEHPSFVAAGDAQYVTPEGIFFRGNSAVWGLDSWNVEYLVADMMFEVYHDRFSSSGYFRSFSYDIGALTDAAVVTWEKGWVTITTVGGVGEPPPPQYLWDSVLELAQVRLHDGGLAEGDADLHLALTGVRVPLTSEQVVESTRPVLEAQKATMAQVMVGDHSTYTSGCDLFLERGADARLYLFFVSPDDVPGLVVTHSRPGLFSDAALSERVSTSAGLGSGDTLHEKVAISAGGGEVYYAEDLDGTVWELTLLPVTTGDEVEILVQPAGPWQ